MSESEIFLYSAISNDWDIPKTKYPLHPWTIYTDNPDLQVPKNVVLKPIKCPKWHKVNLPESEYSVWIDGNVVLTCHPDVLVRNALRNNDIACFTHSYRCCLYQEADYIQAKKLADENALKEQVEFYKKQGVRVGFGLWDTSVLVRRNTPQMKEFSEIWLDQIERFTLRDTLSFAYTCWQMGIKPAVFSGVSMQNEFCQLIPHNKTRTNILWGTQNV